MKNAEKKQYNLKKNLLNNPFKSIKKNEQESMLRVRDLVGLFSPPNVLWVFNVLELWIVNPVRTKQRGCARSQPDPVYVECMYHPLLYTQRLV